MQLVVMRCYWCVATVLTVYGIETWPERVNSLAALPSQQYLPFTVLKPVWQRVQDTRSAVATVLTVYGIETVIIATLRRMVTITSQQYLPFTVLKPC